MKHQIANCETWNSYYYGNKSTQFCENVPEALDTIRHVFQELCTNSSCYGVLVSFVMLRLGVMVVYEDSGLPDPFTLN